MAFISKYPNGQAVDEQLDKASHDNRELLDKFTVTENVREPVAVGSTFLTEPFTETRIEGFGRQVKITVENGAEFILSDEAYGWLRDFAKFAMTNNAVLKLHQNSVHFMSGSSLLQMGDSARIMATGSGFIGIRDIAQLLLTASARLIMDDSAFSLMNNGAYHYMTNSANFFMRNGARQFLAGNARFIMRPGEGNPGGDNINSADEERVSASPRLRLTGHSDIDMDGRSNQGGRTPTIFMDAPNNVTAIGHSPSRDMGRGSFTLGDWSVTSLHCQVTTITALSDERVKEYHELADLNKCVSAVKNLPVHRYKYKDFTGTHLDENVTGFMADDVSKIFPKSVSVLDREFPVLDENGEQVFDEIVEEYEESVFEPVKVKEKRLSAVLGRDGKPIETEVEVEKSVEKKVKRTRTVKKEKTFTLEDVQHIAMSEAVPTLWGAVQALIQRVEELESKTRAPVSVALPSSRELDESQVSKGG